MARASGLRLEAAGVFVFYIALACAYTWPLLPSSRTLLASDAGDPAFNTFVLWWNATRLPFSAAWWNAPQYFPTAGISAFTESLVGIGWVFNPAYWMAILSSRTTFRSSCRGRCRRSRHICSCAS